MFTVTPIGRVRNEVTTPMRRGWGKISSDLVLDERYTEALDGIEDYSHLLVIFWMEQAAAPKALKEHVQGRADLPVIGLFARRAPSRPNPIGVTAVRLLQRDKNILRVRGVDAINGTPLLDIKPYTPAFDRVENACTPEWSKRVYEVEDYF